MGKFLKSLHQQDFHLLRPAIEGLVRGLLMHKRQLAQVVRVAQAVLALKMPVAGQAIMHERAAHPGQQRERLKRFIAALGRGAPASSS